MTKHWWVESPEWEEDLRLLDGCSGPYEWARDAVCVEAPTKRAAVAAGLRLMREWPKRARADGVNPYIGIKALPAACPHGACSCDLVEDCPSWSDECKACDADRAGTE